jgi:short-subunit dehydrogenase
MTSHETALITGASSGIGRELARLFAADHSDLVLVARSEGKLNALADELCDNHGVRVRVLPKDLAVHEAPRDIYDELQADGVQVDVLVNNAGFGARGSVAELDLQRQIDMVQVNVMAVTHLTRLFLPGMIGRHRGGILNIGSTASFEPGPNMVVYYATKAYVLSFTEGLAGELDGTGIKVSCLAPGPTETSFAAVSGMEDSIAFKLGTMDATTVARIGYSGFRGGCTVIVPGLFNKACAFGGRLGPRVIVRKVVKWMHS